MNLEDMTRDELADEVKRRGIKGVLDKSKAAMVEAVRADMARETTEADQGMAVPAPEPPPAAAKPRAPMQGQPLTMAQRDKLRAAGLAEIEAALADTALPLMWRQEFEAERARRVAAHAGIAAKRKLQTPMNRYEITKGGPFVINGRITRLHTGGVIADTTHDLKEVARQGIEFKPLHGHVVVSEDLLGRPVTRIVREEEADPVLPSGKVPDHQG